MINYIDIGTQIFFSHDLALLKSHDIQFATGVFYG